MDKERVITQKNLPIRPSLHLNDFITLWLLFERIETPEWMQGAAFALLVLFVIALYMRKFWGETPVDILAWTKQ